jgi:hypothetical protein
MAAEDRDTLVDRWIRRARNQPIFAALIFIAVCAGGIATFGDSIGRLYKLISPDPVVSAPAREPTAQDAGVLMAELNSYEKSASEARLAIEQWDKSIAEDEAILESLGTKIREQPMTEQERNDTVDQQIRMQDRLNSARRVRDELRASLGLNEARIAALRNRIAASP